MGRIHIGPGAERGVMPHPNPDRTPIGPSDTWPARRRTRRVLAATLFGSALVLVACASSGGTFDHDRPVTPDR